MPNGNYEEYFQNGKLKITGTMVDNYMAEEWIEYWENQQIKKVTTYNKKGQKSGAFKEYYENGKLKSQGQYGIKEIIEKYKCFDPETYAEKECEDKKEFEIKIGDWKYYKETGEVIKN